MQREPIKIRDTKEYKILEQDGLFLDSPEHWEMWEMDIKLSEYPHKQKYIKKNGKESIYLYTQKCTSICIPINIIRHLGLEDNDKILIAIRKI